MNAEFEHLKTRLEDKGLLRLWPPYTCDEQIASDITAMQPDELVGGTVIDLSYAAATDAGLLLWADCLEKSHKLIQEISTETGCYWHGIMHRREPDYNNARYWFQRTGEHAAFPEVYAQALDDLTQDGAPESRKLLSTLEGWGIWEPELFIQLVEQAGNGYGPGEIRALEIVQLAEIRALLDWCWAQATGKI